jgi:eukaryotic-like serine/threonine-protein kinase
VNSLIACHEQLKEFDQAEAWRRKWLAVVKDRSGPDSLPYAGELAALGLNLLQQKRWNDAEPGLRECLALREKKLPDVWETFSTQSMLGGALLGQKKYADAEPLLLSGYEGMKQRKQTIPVPGKPRVTDALDALIELYAATNKLDEVKKWQAERAKYPEGKPAEKK